MPRLDKLSICEKYHDVPVDDPRDESFPLVGRNTAPELAFD